MLSLQMFRPRRNTHLLTFITSGRWLSREFMGMNPTRRLVQRWAWLSDGRLLMIPKWYPRYLSTTAFMFVPVDRLIHTLWRVLIAKCYGSVETL